MSTLDDASSMTTTRVGRKSVRAMVKSCFSPADSVPTTRSSASEASARVAASPTFTSVASISSSVTSPNGARLRRTVPLNSRGRWGITLTARLNVSRPSVETSTPSNVTRPLVSSLTRRSKETSEDLPDPVRPMTPIFSPCRIEKETSSTAGGRSGLYTSVTLEKTMEPLDGHVSTSNASPSSRLTFSGVVFQLASWGRLVFPFPASEYSSSRSSDANDS